MAVRKRYYIWLARAYFKKWKKTILFSVVIGISIFFLAVSAFNYFLQPRVNDKVNSVGYQGTYTLTSAPKEIFNDVSYGLTKIDENGKVVPGAAEKWSVSKDGKKYTFYLARGQKFHDGEELTARNLSLNFEGVKKEVIDDYTVSYTLGHEFSPFLTSVSKPILKQNLAGLGDYKITDIGLNAGFIKQLTLENTEDSSHKKKIYFYPTQESLKTAYALGEIEVARDVKNLKFLDTKIDTWPNTKVTEDVAYDEMVALFYNNKDSTLSDKKVRQALTIALPEKFSEGLRADSPISPKNAFYEKNVNYLVGDTELAKELLETAELEDDTKFEITTTAEFEDIAKTIQKSWKDIGISSTVKIVKSQPDNFQIFLTKYTLPQDADQYTLWHSDERNNIIRYKNLRIDKLLEDGRVTTSESDRRKIYADFQKYLLDDAPAAFLYLPMSYSISRG